MPSLPLVKVAKSKREVTDSFLGLNKNSRIKPNEFAHMENLTSTHFPLLSSREKRGVLEKLSAPQALFAKSGLVWIDGGRLFMDGREVEGLSLSEGEKSLVSMGAYLLIFPDKLYLNCENPADFGSIEAEFESSEPVTYSLCSLTAEDFGSPTVSPHSPGKSPERHAVDRLLRIRPHSQAVFKLCRAVAQP